MVFSLTSSVTHVGFIAVQRAIAVASPFKVKQIITMSRCHIILALMWIISVGLAIFAIGLEKLGFMILSSIAILIGIALIIIYSIICYITLKKNIAYDNSENTQRRRRQSEKEVLMYSVAITVVYIVCSYPKSFIQFMTSYPAYVFIASNALLSINPLLDPLLYFLSSYVRRKRESKRSTRIASMQTRSLRAAAVITTQLWFGCWYRSSMQSFFETLSTFIRCLSLKYSTNTLYS